MCVPEADLQLNRTRTTVTGGNTVAEVRHCHCLVQGCHLWAHPRISGRQSLQQNAQRVHTLEQQLLSSSRYRAAFVILGLVVL